MYIKPKVFQTEDLTEGVYAASGSGGTGTSLEASSSSPSEWDGGGQATFSVTIPAAFAGKNIILTFNFDRQIDWAWGGFQGEANGTSVLTAKVWNVASGQVVSATVGSNSGLPECSSVSIDTFDY